MSQGWTEEKDVRTDKAPEHQRVAKRKVATRISNAKIRQAFTPSLKRKMLLSGMPSKPKVHYNAQKSGIINNEIYIGYLVKHPEMRRGLVDSWTLRLLYPVHAKDWMRVKNVGNIRLLSGKHYAGYSRDELIIEDFVRSATHWIESTDFKIAMKIGNITQEDVDSRLQFFEDLFEN